MPTHAHPFVRISVLPGGEGGAAGGTQKRWRQRFAAAQGSTGQHRAAQGSTCMKRNGAREPTARREARAGSEHTCFSHFSPADESRVSLRSMGTLLAPQSCRASVWTRARAITSSMGMVGPMKASMAGSITASAARERCMAIGLPLPQICFLRLCQQILHLRHPRGRCVTWHGFCSRSR